MRYFIFAYLFAAAFTILTFHLETDHRTPASYPNFSGVEALEPVAPVPQELRAPEGARFSMKDIEDTYKFFLDHELDLKKQAAESRARLQYYLKLRNSNPNYNYYLNASSKLLQAIAAEQNNLQRIEGLRESNSSFAFHRINILYLSIQIGLKPESHVRKSVLTDYIMSVNYSAMASNPTYALVQTPTSPIWNDAALLEFTPQYAGTVSRTPEEITNPLPQAPLNNDFIGPRLPETIETLAPVTAI